MDPMPHVISIIICLVVVLCVKGPYFSMVLKLTFRGHNLTCGDPQITSSALIIWRGSVHCAVKIKVYSLTHITSTATLKS